MKTLFSRSGRGGRVGQGDRAGHVRRARRELLRWGWVAVLTAALTSTPRAVSSDSAAPVADAAMRKDGQAVRALVRQGGDVNASQGDGMTALHWAAIASDADLTSLLLYAGANVRATTRIGGYTPLHLASQSGSRAVIDALVGAGAGVDAATATGATPLMLAASAGQIEAVNALLDHQADPNATEKANGETALMFAAALGRDDVVRLLVQRGATTALTSRVVDLMSVTAPEEALQKEIRDKQNAESAARTGGAPPPPDPAAFQAPATRDGVAGATRPYSFNELIGKQGGLTALHFAARQGALQTARALVESGADLNDTTGDCRHKWSVRSGERPARARRPTGPRERIGNDGALRGRERRMGPAHVLPAAARATPAAPFVPGLHESPSRQGR